MTNSFDELARAGCLFVIGSNTTVAHPMVGMRLMRCQREGGRLIVADPRRTDLARLADVPASAAGDGRAAGQRPDAHHLRKRLARCGLYRGAHGEFRRAA